MTRTVTAPVFLPIIGEIEHATEKAIYFVSQNANDKTVKCWIPKSQVFEYKKADFDPIYQTVLTLNIADWIVTSKGLHSLEAAD